MVHCGAKQASPNEGGSKLPHSDPSPILWTLRRMLERVSPGFRIVRLWQAVAGENKYDINYNLFYQGDNIDGRESILGIDQGRRNRSSGTRQTGGARRECSASQDQAG